MTISDVSMLGDGLAKKNDGSANFVGETKPASIGQNRGGSYREPRRDGAVVIMRRADSDARSLRLVRHPLRHNGSQRAWEK